MTGTPHVTVQLVHFEHDDDPGGHEDPVGTAATVLMPHLTYGSRPSAFIEAVVVAYAHRRRGVARLLVQRALDDARKASCRKVQLLSHERRVDDGAHQLDRSWGFAAESGGFRLHLARCLVRAARSARSGSAADIAWAQPLDPRRDDPAATAARRALACPAMAAGTVQQAAGQRPTSIPADHHGCRPRDVAGRPSPLAW
ncbi:GNAT family N-acetyltransferase [Modestobacter sp. VKM Ac-2981]|uniref:GNAT family N-acetyltransferase n=1 Tax=unclassified Modestobacter TaxID=2643866 RepID=UPI003FA59EE6